MLFCVILFLAVTGLFAIFLLQPIRAYARSEVGTRYGSSRNASLTTNPPSYERRDSWLPEVYVPARGTKKTRSLLPEARSLNESKSQHMTTTAQSGLCSKTERISGLISVRSFASHPITQTGKLTTTNGSNAGHLSARNNTLFNIKPEPAERRVLFAVQSVQADNYTMRLDKAAHIANILALIPAGFCAYVSWVVIHSQQSATNAASDMPSSKLVWLAVGAFFGLFMLGAVLGIIALIRKNPVVAAPVAEPINETKAQEPVLQQVGEPPLQDRVGKVARDLLQFLQEHGPAPKVEGHNSDARWQSMRDALHVNRERLPKINDGYMARFHDRVEKIVYELGAIGVRDWELNNLLNKDAYSDADVESIANGLLALGSQLVVQDYTSRFKVSQPNQTSEVLPPTAPRPYLEVEDPIDERFGKTLFHFTNRGGDVAHTIQVQPLTINHLSVVFDPISDLAVNKTKTTIPTIPGIGVEGGHDILNQMEKDWERALLRPGGKEDENGEWVEQITATYEDFAGKKFEATMDLVVFPMQRLHRNRNALQNPRREYKTVEVRNTKFRQIL
jgi:hypothetical protein